MPQFDILTFNTQVITVFIAFYLFYIISLRGILSEYVIVKKYRLKKNFYNTQLVDNFKKNLTKKNLITTSLFIIFFYNKRGYNLIW